MLNCAGSGFQRKSVTLAMRQHDSNGERTASRPALCLSLLGGFELKSAEGAVRLAAGVRRLVAYLALQQRTVGRRKVASELWPDCSEARCSASLRSALWRLGAVGTHVTEVDATCVALHPSVAVDFHAVRELAARTLDHRAPVTEPGAQIRALSNDLLPDWDEEWIVTERERFRQLRLHALDVLCMNLTLDGRFGHALDAGLSAIDADPLRESSRIAVMRAYLAQGNRSEAIRHYQSYRQVLNDELGLSPGAELEQLIAR